MKLTSSGYHTFSFYQGTSMDLYQEIESDFNYFFHNNQDIIGRTPILNKKEIRTGWIYYYYNNKGIRWVLNSSTVNQQFYWFGITSVINPKTLLDNDYIRAAQENDLELIEDIYNNEAQKISKYLYRFGECSVNRADYCMNIDLDELGIPCSPEQMISLIQQGNIPGHFKERRQYDTQKHRKVADPNSFYLISDSVNINYYWKYAQQNNIAHPNFSSREVSRNVIRFETQYKHQKLYPLIQSKKKNSKFYFSEDHNDYWTMFYCGFRNPSIPVDIALTSDLSTTINKNYFQKIIGQGHYFTMKLAKQIVESYHFRPEKEERMIYTLEAVKKYHGIAKAKAALHGPDLDDLKKSIRDLNNIGVNPVTIPKRWRIKYIPNLFQRYEEMLYEEELISVKEHVVKQHIEQILFS